MLKRIAPVAISAILLSLAAFSDTDIGKPVPETWLHRGNLVVSGLNFSIATPPDSHWFYRNDFPDVQSHKVTVFILEKSDQSRFLVNVWDSGGRMDLGNPVEQKSFIDHMVKEYPKGWQLVGTPQFERSSIPIVGSWKVTIPLRIPGRGILYARQYSVSGKRSYSLIDYSPDPNEPPDFTKFVSTFRLLSPNDIPPATSSLGLPLLVAFVAWVIDRRYIMRGGKRSTRRDKIGLYAALGLAIVAPIVLGMIFNNPEAAGEMVGVWLIVVFCAWEIRRWIERRRNPVKNFVIQ